MTSKIALAADHAGFEEKEKIKQALAELGVEFVDMGTASTDSVDYPDYAQKVGAAVSKGEFEQGVLVCGSGTGMAIAANKIKGVRAAVASMIALNDTASAIMRAAAVHACSDVTGFGLLGHSFEMASGSGVTIVLESRKLPLLPGARALAKQGCLTGGAKRNRAYLANKVAVERSVRGDLVDVAFDPQTSGGLLIALPAERAGALVDQLHASGVAAAVQVGRATAAEDVSVRLV